MYLRYASDSRYARIPRIEDAQVYWSIRHPPFPHCLLEYACQATCSEVTCGCRREIIRALLRE